MNEIKILKKFIVLEGLDGAGTSTQLLLLDKKLIEIQTPHICTYEPTNGFIGQQIRRVLNKELSTKPETLAFLFVADRYEHLYTSDDGILAELKRGKMVISDRYIFSSLAYQGVDCDFSWVRQLNSTFPLPEYLIFINTPLEICQQRLSKRKHREIFDARGYQEKIANAYEQVLDLYRQTELKISIIDGSLTMTQIFQQIWTIITSLPIISSV